jgi:hypothetical protein
MGIQFTTEDQPDLTIPADTILRAKLLELKPREINWIDRKTNEPKSKLLLEWWWEVTSGDYTGRRVKGECDAKLTNHPGNRFHNWAETILGRQIPVGMGIDTDDLVGLSADISVGHRPDKKDPAKVWEFVDEVMPITGGFDMGGDPPF